MAKKQDPRITPEVFKFLKAIKKNNNREWFARHKDEYEKAHADMIAFADALLHKMNIHDRIETPTGKKSLHRIYRDTRFSKNKTPYKFSWNGGFQRSGKERRGGYYFHIEPGNTYLAGGFFGPNTDDLARIRQEMASNPEEFRQVLKKKARTFPKLEGEQLKLAPAGYPKGHPAIDLLRHKQFILRHRFTDSQVLSQGFLKLMDKTFQDLRPFFDLMSDVLTSDINGTPLE